MRALQISPDEVTIPQRCVQAFVPKEPAHFVHPGTAPRPARCPRSVGARAGVAVGVQ